MEKKNYEQVVLSNVHNHYRTTDELLSDLGKMIQLLTKYGYECKVYDDESDIYVIQYESSPRLGYGNDFLRWVSPEEDELLWAQQDVIESVKEEEKEE